jgi:hypothetical protein
MPSYDIVESPKSKVKHSVLAMPNALPLPLPRFFAWLLFMKLNPWRFRRRRGLSILSRVILFLLLPVMIVGSLLGGIFLNQVEQMIERRLQEDVEIIARALRKPVSYAYERGG